LRRRIWTIGLGDGAGYHNVCVVAVVIASLMAANAFVLTTLSPLRNTIRRLETPDLVDEPESAVERTVLGSRRAYPAQILQAGWQAANASRWQFHAIPLRRGETGGLQLHGDPAIRRAAGASRGGTRFASAGMHGIRLSLPL
jgi:hypothetical protein